MQVAENQIGSLALGQQQTFLAVNGLERRVPEGAQEIRHEIQVFRVVVDDEYARWHCLLDLETQRSGI